MNKPAPKLLLAALTATSLVSPSSEAQQAAQPAASPGNLEEIVVTARRRNEQIQSVPIAITAFSQETLTANNVKAAQDLQFFVPSMTVASPNRDTAFVAIRGQGGYAPGGSPAVTSYLNEVPIPLYNPSYGSAFGPGNYFDLASVEVLKGPQGTLFGQNSTGGALTLVSKRPTNEFGGYAEVTLGNYGDREFDGAINVPVIADKLLVRVAGFGQFRDGFTTMLGTVGAPNARIDLDNRQFVSFRATISFMPTDDIRNDFIADYNLSTPHGSSYILGAVNPIGSAAFVFPGVLAELARQQALGPRTEIEGLVNDPTGKTVGQGFTDIFSYDVTDDITLRNIAGYRFAESTSRANTTGGVFPILTDPTLTIYPVITKQYTEEPQLQGKSLGGKLTWVLGGYFQNDPISPFNVTLLQIFGTDFVDSSQTAESTQAVYTQETYDLSDLVDGLKFTGGFRYTWDRRFLASRSIIKGFCLTPGADAQCTLSGTGLFHAPTWTIDFDYQLLPETLVYVTSRRGYRSGGFNSFTVVKSDQAFQPEYVTDLELGLKSTFDVAGMKARTNVAAYHQWYDSVQVADTVLQNGNPASVTLNAASAELSGVEFEGSLIPTKGLQLNASYSYGQAGFTSFASPQAAAANQTFKWTNVPRHKITVGADYHLPVDASLGDVSVGFDFTWQDHFFNASIQDPLNTTPTLGLLNLRAQWQNMFEYPVDLSFFMTNATDRTYVLGDFGLYSTLGTSSAIYGEPRMFGFRLRYRFGSDAE